MGKRKFRGNDDSEGWINRRFRDLEQQIRELRAAKTLDAATIGNGGLQVVGNGGIQMFAPDGTSIFGAIGYKNNPDPDGNPQPIVFMHRNDGSQALTLDDPIPTEDGYHQILRLWDRAGNEIFAEDATSGQGIANPWIPFPMYLARYTDWPKSTSGTFETIWQNQVSVKNATLTLGASYTSDASDTSGEIRCQVNGVTVGSTLSIAFAIATNYLANQSPWPSTVEINDSVTITVQMRRTAGTGNVMCSPILTSGSQST